MDEKTAVKCTRCNEEWILGEDKFRKVRNTYSGEFVTGENGVKVFEIICDRCVRIANKDRLFYDADIPPRYRNMTFDGFEADLPELATIKSQVIELAKSGSWIVLLGKRGTGKTHLAISALKESIYNGNSATYLSAATFIPRLVRSGFNRNKLWFELIEPYKTVMIDDLGQGESLQSEGEANQRAREEIGAIIDRGYRMMGQMIITTNIETVEELFERYDAWAIDRILECGRFIKMPNISSKRPDIWKQQQKKEGA